MAEEYVNFVTSFAVPKAMTLEEIKQATAEDVTLQYLAKNNSWNSLYTLPEKFKDADCAELSRFQRVKGNLTINDQANIILRGSCIVIPKNLQERAILITHEGHQGLVKTKQLLRENVWFPKLTMRLREK